MIRILICCVFLTGCIGPNVRTEAIQESLLAKCPETLPELQDGTGRQVALTMREWASEYHSCAIRHNGLVRHLRSDD